MGFSYKELNQNLPSGWKFIKISDIADVNPEAVNKNYQKDIIRYIDISSVSTGVFESPRPIPFKDAPSRARRIVREGDIIISTVRPNLRQYTLLEDVEDNWIASTGFAVIRAKDKKSKWYLYSFLTSNVFNEYLVRVADGAAYPTFNPKEIEEAEIPFPDEDSLETISNLAKVLMQKTELNNKINSQLEHLAQAIFKSWFVDFAPVHSKKNALEAKLTKAQAERASMAVIAGLCSPSEYTEKTEEIEKKLEQRLSFIGKEKSEELKTIALLFPSEFEDSELGTIPKGWDVSETIELCKRAKSGGTPSRKNDYYWENGTIPWLGSGEVRDKWIITAKEKITELGRAHSSADYLPIYTTIIAMYGATAGQVGMNGFEVTTNQACCGLIPKDGYEFFNYCLISRLTDKYLNLANGAAQQNISQEIIREFKITSPSENLIKQFNLISTPIFKRIFSNTYENVNLNSLRDTLVPKLLMGEFDLGGVSVD